jgi:PhnB protein
MSKAIRPVPAGHESLIPHLVCDPCADAMEFYKRAFGAEEIDRVPAPDGRRIVHAAIRIGGGGVFLVDDFPEFSGARPPRPRR